MYTYAKTCTGVRQFILISKVILEPDFQYLFFRLNFDLLRNLLKCQDFNKSLMGALDQSKGTELYV